MVSKMGESIVPETILDPTMKKFTSIAPLGIGAVVDPAGYSADAYIFDQQRIQDVKDAQSKSTVSSVPTNETPEEKRKREGVARHKSHRTNPKLNLQKSKVINGINTKVKAEIPRTSNIDFIMGKKMNNSVVMQGVDVSKIKKSFGSPINAMNIVGMKNKKVVMGVDVNRMKSAIKCHKIVKKKLRIK